MKTNQAIAGAFLLVLSCNGKDPAPEPPIDIPEEPIVCEQSACWHSDFYVCRDTFHIDLFTRSKGWTGADATYSIALQEGKNLWMFGDTFIDQVRTDRSRPSFRLIRNSLVLQEGESFETIHGGTASMPDAFAKPPEPDDWYWPGDGTVANGKVYLFMHGFGTSGAGSWDFYRTSIDLLTLNLETLAIEDNRRLFDNPAISWGAAIMEEGDVTYVYGVMSVNAVKDLYVARTNNDLSETWEYFDGSGWHIDPFQAAPIYSGVSEQFSVFKDGSTYYLLTQHNLFGKEIYLLTSSSPEGAFSDKRTIYCTPETGGNIWTYNAFAHPQVYSDSMLISYNVNSLDANDLLESADNYRPYFVRVGNWRK
jgi:hypothetical protein